MWLGKICTRASLKVIGSVAGCELTGPDQAGTRIQEFRIHAQDIGKGLKQRYSFALGTLGSD